MTTYKRSKREYKTALIAWRSIVSRYGKIGFKGLKSRHTNTYWIWETSGELKKKNPELILVNKKSKTAKSKVKKSLYNPTGIIGRIPGTINKIYYDRTGKNKGSYSHKFENPVEAFALKDGSVLLKPKKKGQKIFVELD